MKDRPNLAKYKETITTPLRQATLCFLVKGDEVLLAMKKRGFGEGKWNGVGGKVDDIDASVVGSAEREVFEEIVVTPTFLEKVAVLNFYFLDASELGQQVTVYLSKKWEGEPTETEEMKPEWFDISEIPYDKMWEDEKHWLPLVLGGIEIEADFLFDSKEILLEKEVREIDRR